MKYAVDLDDVRAAAKRIAPYAHRTPVFTCSALDERAGRRLFLKAEHLQKVGAFKFRGACNAVQRLADADAARGVVTHSSGNHAQALALAARIRGIPAHIVMPSNASAPKRRAVEGYGARVIECEPTLPAREETAARVVEETGGTLISPYDHPDIIAGQGTAALELLQDFPDLDVVLAPVGGGGLFAGTCVVARGLDPRVEVWAAEPAGADDAARSFAAGEWIPQREPRTIADGLLTSLGQLTWPILRDLGSGVITVSEDEIVQTMRLCWERAKLMIEASSAVAVAAAGKGWPAGQGPQRVGVILSGGNVDLDRLPWGSAASRA
jgi:threonine dehydratase/serine racemase